MSTTATAAPVTAPKTENTDAPVIPGREEVLKHFASEALRGTEPKAAEPEPESASQDDGGGDDKGGETAALSQQGNNDEPQWTPEQKAWFDVRAKATTPEEIEAAENSAPEFQPEQIEWLNKNGKELGSEPAMETDDHLKDDAELKGALPDEVQERVNKRIGKEVARTKAEKEKRELAEAKAAELQQQLEARGSAPVPVPSGPLSTVGNPEQLEQVKAGAEEAVSQADQLLENLADGDVESVEQALKSAKVELPEFSDAAMKKFLRSAKANAETMLRKHVPARERFLKESAVHETKVLELMPELKDKTSPRHAKFLQAVAALPNLRDDPAWAMKAYVHVLGMEAWEKQQTAAKSKTNGAGARPKRELPSRIPVPRTAAVQTQRQVRKDDVTNEDAEAALNGDKSARSKILTSVVRGLGNRK